MAPPSFIPGYKNLITETLYQKQVDYPFISNIKTNIYAKQDYDFVRESNGSFISAYHHQYKADVPYKCAVFTPSVLPPRNANRQCNPFVAYPYGVPEGIEKEKCMKCKGEKKCNKKRRNKQKRNKQCIDMDNNTKENDNEEISSPQSKTRDNNIEMKESEKKDLTENEIKNSQFLNVIEDSTYAKSIGFSSNTLPCSNNFQEIYSNSIGICDENIGAIVTSNDIECFIHVHSSSLFEKNNKQILNESFADNLNNYNKNQSTYKDIHNDNISYLDIKKVNFTNDEDLNNYNDSTSGNGVNFNGTMSNDDKKLYLKTESENNKKQCNLYDYSYNIETEIVADNPYDLDFNPFTNESYNTNKEYNNSNSIEHNNNIEHNNSTDATLESESREIISILKEKNSVNFFLNVQKENNENENENIQKKVFHIDNNSNKNKKQSIEFEEKCTGKIDMENEINGKENLAKKITKKKKNNTNSDSKSLNKIKKFDDKLNKYAKHSYTHFEQQKKVGQKRVCKMEDVIGQIAKNEAELKAGVELKSRYRISMTNTDEAFPLSSVRSLRSAKKLSDKKKTLPFKNPNNKESKTGFVPQIAIPKNPSFNSKKSGKHLSNNKLVKSNTKSINAYANKKKKTIIGKITNGIVTKKINTPLLLKKKSKAHELVKQNVNKTEAEGFVGNFSEIRENNEIEGKEEKVEEETEDEEEDPTKRKLLLSRSTTKFYGKKKSVPFKDVQVKRYTNQITEPAKRKETIKFKNIDLSDKKKKLETKKSKKVIVLGPDTTSKSYRKVTIAGKLRSKKKELYTNILNLTQNIKPKEPVEDIKKKRESKEKLQTIPKVKKMV